MVNPRTTRLPEPLGRDEKVEPNSSEALAVDMVGTGKRVLALGSAGDLTLLLAAAGNRVTTVDAQEAAAGEARAAAESFVAADLDDPRFADVLAARTFDVVLLGRALEASRDVRRLLENARRFLVPGGYAVLDVPNIAHGSIRLGFLRGRYELAGSGPLDGPNRRFFTLKTLHEWCFYAGFRIVEIERVKAPVFAAEGPAQILKPDELDREILRELEADPEFDTLRFIVRAAPLGDEERLGALVDIAVEAEMQLNASRDELARAERRALEAGESAAELERRVALEAAARALAEEEAAVYRERLERAERQAGGESTAAANARVEVLAEQLRLAHERVAEVERRADRLREESATARAEAAALRDGAERARAALEAAEEANRERDAAVEARDAADAAWHAMKRELDEARSDVRASAIADLQAALERESGRLRAVVAERDAQQSAAAAFFAHIDAELARTRREIAHVDAMIRAVQSSKWWTLKRAFGKARRIAANALRRR